MCILEMFTPGFFVIGIGASCIVTSLPAALHAPFALQLVVFAVALVLFFAVLRPLVLKFSGEGKASGTDAMKAKVGVVTKTVDNTLGTGRVKIGGEDWKARAEDNEVLEAGTEVCVVEIKGVTAYIRRK